MAHENVQFAKRSSMRSSAASQETIRATPPMDIPNTSDPALIVGSPNEDEERLSMDYFMRNRKTSISFDNEVRTDFGHRQSMDQPLPKTSRETRRGRSALHDLQEEHNHQREHSPSLEHYARRSHSESYRDRYNPETGRRLPQFSTTPPREEPHVGEHRFPLLQETVDEMARESSLKLNTQPMSMTSQSTVSTTSEAVFTPRDDDSQYPLSPLPISPNVRNISTSLENSATRPFRRTASQRWRDGEQTQDFFSRAATGSLRKGNREGSSLKSSSRRGTASSYNTNSVASSFLRGFSMTSSGDGESAAPPAVDAEGQTIGEDYVLGKQIGFGGFSTIKEVTQFSAETGKSRKLAVKIVKRTIENKSESENDAAQAEFDHEVELWRFLNHPNILPLEAVYKLDEATFCFIPLNTGGTLFDLLRANRQGVSTDVAIHYAYQLASALRYLHLDARVVHRDIKLENCLIETVDGEPGVLRLCDFGMADWLDNDLDANSPVSTPGSSDRPPPKAIGPADTSTSAFAGGSLEYAPPEIVRVASSASLCGQLAPPNARTESPSSLQRNRICSAVDIWAFGVCLYTMITGKRPFSDSFAPRVVMAILAGNWDRDLLVERSKEDSDLLELVNGCLSLSEKQRWTIRTVVECQWFDEERDRVEAGQDNRTGGWRL